MAKAGTCTPRGGEAGDPPQFVFRCHDGELPSRGGALLGITPKRLVVRLSDAGFAAAGPDEPLTDIATASGQDEFALLRALLATAG